MDMEPNASELQRTTQEGALSNGRADPSGLRVIHLTRFEEALPVSPSEREGYRRRFVTLFVDEAKSRRGGLGKVAPAFNVRGEKLAIKMPHAPKEDDCAKDASARVDRKQGLECLFRQEYEVHRSLNGMQGLPRLYGFGYVDESPVIVMEWVHGMTLREARDELAVDSQCRVPALAVARLGQSLFDLLVQMEHMGGGLVHRDLSPSNILVRTDRLSLKDQTAQGSFDLCLVDFGSADAMQVEGDASLTATAGIVRGATADYAPPEMLTTDLPHAERLRRDPRVDVYAAASVLYELFCGHVPYDLSQSGLSPYRTKVDRPPARPVGAYGATHDLEHALAQDPDVATEAAVALLEVSPTPSAEDIRQCLALVEDQLADLLLACLEPRQDRRPQPDGMRSALAAFCSCHGENVRRALAGERLIPCTSNSAWYASASPVALRRMLRSAGTGVSLAIWGVVVLGTSILVQGVGMTVATFHVTLQAPVVALALAAPAVLGVVTRGGERGSAGGFVRGSLVLVACSLLLAALVSEASFDGNAHARGLLAAVLASCVAGWCPLVLGYATTVMPGLRREVRRQLPTRKDELAPARTHAPAHSSSQSPETGDDVSYEVPDDRSIQA